MKTEGESVHMQRNSQEWMNQFNVGGGGPILECFCARVHVAIDSIDLDDLDKRRYKAAAQGSPNKYVLHHDVDSVTEHTINGQLIVDDCPCGTMLKFESFVLRERDFIIGYYRAVASKAAEDAKSFNAAIASLDTVAAGRGTNHG